MNTLVQEHEKKDGLTEDVFYPDHAPRVESKTFERTKRTGHDANLPCAISGQVADAEYHHVFIEWAFADAIDWEVVKGIALGQITHLPVLDLRTDQPTGQSFPAEQSLIYVITRLAAARGFDWSAFDPTDPSIFVDSMANMLVLNARFHRLTDHGIHMMSFPEWVFHAWPRKAGFIFTPDEKST